ncbi:DNA-directed RNA polymerase sigma-70 factor [Allostella vacuolata]|nr:DNA-directed RNA polymerase sigma-70 factor [Stella vacuolata]
MTDALLRTLLNDYQALAGAMERRNAGERDAAIELLHDMFVKLASAERPPARVENPGGFLWKMLRNFAADGHRRRAVEARLFDRDGLPETAADPADPERILSARQRLAAVQQAFDEMSPRVRQVFWLRRIEGCSQADTAARLGISPSATEKAMTRAMLHLMNRLADLER